MLRNFLLLPIVFLIVSCNSNLVWTKYQSTDKGVWNKENSIKFEFSEMDTIQSYNLFINIRNDENYPYSNLFLIAALNSPNGKTIKDTLEYEMAKPNGEWLGKGYSGVKENKLWYKENIVFNSKDVYTIEITHAMRKNGKVNGVINLEGITDVGLQIEKSK